MSTTSEFQRVATQVAAGAGFSLLGDAMSVAMKRLMILFGSAGAENITYDSMMVVGILLNLLLGLIYIMSGFIRKKRGHVYRIVGMLVAWTLLFLIGLVLF